ncbi:DUF397 domain-containing protein [Actinomadura logoneensis]
MTKSQWRKSSYSSDKGDDCVEVAGELQGVLIRDSKNPDAGNVLVERHAFGVVLGRIRSLGQA